MKDFLKKGLVFLVILAVFTTYLFLVSERIERLEHEDESEIVNVSILYGDWNRFYGILKADVWNVRVIIWKRLF